MKLAVGSDERTHVTDMVVAWLEEAGHEVQLYGPLAAEEAYWPVVAKGVGEAVAAGDADEGVLFCWTGTGVSIAANKIKGIRAALCADAEIARGARLWNDANVICLSLRRTSEVMAKEILTAWFEHKYQPNDVDNTCLAQVSEIEAQHMRESV